jgi:hypothetical protein
MLYELWVAEMVFDYLRYLFIYRYVLEFDHMKKFFDYIQLPNFDIASDASATFKVSCFFFPALALNTESWTKQHLRLLR